MGTTTTELYIDGKWKPALAGGMIDIIDPATEELVTRAAQADRDDVNAAIDAAHKAFLSWRKVAPWERSKVLRKAAQLVAERSDVIARQLTLETGKPLAPAIIWQDRRTASACDALKAAGLARGGKDGVRLLGKGEIKAKANFKVAGVSKGAREAVEKAGGSVEVPEAPAAQAEA